MALVPILVPVLQQAFPHDKHIFAYTGCTATIECALSAAAWSDPWARKGTIPPLDQAHHWNFHQLASTIPLTRKGLEQRAPSSGVMSGYGAALAALPVSYASIVETWMSAVDTLLSLKEDEKNNGYVPYVFQMDYVVWSTGEEHNDVVDDYDPPPKVLKVGSPQYWSVRSLLQYVTGSQSRELLPEALDAAASVLHDSCVVRRPSSRHRLSALERNAVQSVVFQHKKILLEHKTLIDTVQPSQHWTLKGVARKGGCACCGPEDDEDDEENEEETNGVQSRSSGAGLGLSQPKAKYVDGKTAFAFDPSRFS